MSERLPLWRVGVFLLVCFVVGVGLTLAILRARDEEKADVGTQSVPTLIRPSVPAAAGDPVRRTTKRAPSARAVAVAYIRASAAYRAGEGSDAWRARIRRLLAPDMRRGRIDPPRSRETIRAAVVSSELKFETDIDAELLVTYKQTTSGNERIYVTTTVALKRVGSRWYVTTAKPLDE